MKLQIFKNEDGTWSVVVRKTRPKENPTAAVYRIAQEDVEEAIARLVAEVSGTQL